MAREPRIVAELGRPETPEETAARKAENSRKHRANQTTLNLVLALAASLAIVLVIVLIVVRPDQSSQLTVDWRAAAAESQEQVAAPLLSPDLPETWSANAADLTRGSDDIVEWYIGFVTPGTEAAPGAQFIGLREGIEATPSWLDDVLESSPQTGDIEIGDITWAVYDARDRPDAPGNLDYALSTTTTAEGEIPATTIVVYGTAQTDEFELLATAVAQQLTAAGIETEGNTP